MCCTNNPIKAEELYRKIKRAKGKKVFYKLYIPDDYTGYHLRSVWRYAKIYSDGIVESNSWITTPEESMDSREKSCNIFLGIHVYLTKQIAKKCMISFKEKIVKINVKADNLLGCDKETAVFTKVEIPKEEWEKIRGEFEEKKNKQ